MNGYITAFSSFCFFGVYGILVDLDHFFAVLWAGRPLTWYNLHAIGRQAHTPAFVLSGVILLAVIPYVAGWIASNRFATSKPIDDSRDILRVVHPGRHHQGDSVCSLCGVAHPDTGSVHIPDRVRA